MAFPFISRREGSRAIGKSPELPEIAGALLERAVELGDVAEAFLSGHLVEHLVTRRRPVPAWAVLNKLAHATIDELADLARTDGDRAPDERIPRWRRAQSALAADVLDAAPAPDALVGLQHRLLVPLELWMIDRSRSETITSRRVIETASELLDDLRPPC